MLAPMGLYQHSTNVLFQLSKLRLWYSSLQFGRCAPTLQRNLQRMKTVSSLKMLVPPT